MSLSINSYFKNKSIKLSDSYLVRLVSGNSNITAMCAAFTVPKIEFEEDVYSYGNVSQTFLIPKYDSVKEVTLELYDIDTHIKKFLLKNGAVGSQYKLSQKIDDSGFSLNSANYSNLFDFDKMIIEIYSNNLNYVVYSYRFDNLKISKYSLYDLDYTSDAICKMSITFCFQKYYKFDGPALSDEEINIKLSESNEKTDYEPFSFSSEKYDPPEKLKLETVTTQPVLASGETGTMALGNPNAGILSDDPILNSYNEDSKDVAKNKTLQEIRKNAEKMVNNAMSKKFFGDNDYLSEDEYNKLYNDVLEYIGVAADSSPETAKKVNNYIRVFYTDQNDDDKKEVKKQKKDRLINNLAAFINYEKNVEH